MPAPLRRSSVPTFAKLKLPEIVTAPLVAEPTRRVPAVIAASVPAGTKLLEIEGASPALSGARATVPRRARTGCLPSCNCTASSVMDRVRPAPDRHRPGHVDLGIESASEKSPVLAKAAEVGDRVAGAVRAWCCRRCRSACPLAAMDAERLGDVARWRPRLTFGAVSVPFSVSAARHGQADGWRCPSPGRRPTGPGRSAA